MRSTRLLLTVDVERDYGPGWATPAALTFASVRRAIPEQLTPLCAATGARPTYLVSPEVLCDPDSVAVLLAQDDCELGAHLHCEYLPGGLPRPRWTDPAARVQAMQGLLSERGEATALATLTELFAQQFGRRPTAFRAGRFGAGPHTGRLLARLGYRVDSSVTPGAVWTDPAGRPFPDHRGAPLHPYRVAHDGDVQHSGAGPLLEVPVTIVPAHRIGEEGDAPVWLRPWQSTRQQMLAILEAAARDEDQGQPWGALCVMFHSMELVAGASPYPQTAAEVGRYLADLGAVLERARQLGFAGRTLSEFEDEVAAGESGPLRRSALAETVRLEDWSPAAPAAATWQVDFPGIDLDAVLQRHGAQPWFCYSWRQRAERWDLCLGYDWLRHNIAPDGAVLDVGCGIGLNLHWLWLHGVRDLWGCDVDPKAVGAARELAESSGRPMRFWADDGRRLAGAPARRFQAIAALNWTQLVASFDLGAFLRRVEPLLADDGVLLLDYIDRSFEQHPDHQHLTSDWPRPAAERRPSEYPTRFHPAALQHELARQGLRMERLWHVPGPVPRGVVACRREGAPRPAGAESHRPPRPRPTVLLVVDSPGWAHDHKAHNLARCLADEFDVRIAYQEQVTAAQLTEADLVVVWYWRQLQSMPRHEDLLARIRHKLLLGVCSHNELEGEHREPGIAALRRLPRAVFTHSLLLEREVRQLLPGTVSWCLPNGVDAAFFTPGTPPAATGPLRVGWAGSLDNFGADMRGVTTILQPAVAGLPGVELVLAAREQRLRTPAEMRDFYRGLHVYACASRVEGTPNPALEAAACGVPVVSTAVGNMPELIRHGSNGLLVERSPAAFAAAFARLRDDRERCMAMGRAARRAIEADWDWGRRAEGYRRLFRSVLDAACGAELAAARTRAGVDRLAAEDAAAAMTVLQGALDADGGCALAHAHLADLWWRRADGRLTAIGHQRTALRLGARDPEVRRVLGRLLLEQGQSAAAAALARA